MQKNTYKKILLPLITLLVLIAAWELAIVITETPMYIMPSPSEIVKALFNDISTLLSEAWVTLCETILGIVIATAIGIAIGILMDVFGLFREAVYPILVISQAVPVIVLAPIFIIYFGFGIVPKLITVVLMCFFPIVINFADGLHKVDFRLVSLIKSYGANVFQVYRIIKIPAAISSLFTGLKIAATYSVTGAVVGEWLTSDSGLGYYMLITKNGYMLDKMFASILVVILLSLGMNGIVRFLQYLIEPTRKQREKERGDDYAKSI